MSTSSPFLATGARLVSPVSQKLGMTHNTSLATMRAFDNEGKQVLTTGSQSGTPTDTVSFDDYTETTITSGTSSTTTYYSINGQRLAVRVNGSTIDYLVSDLLGNVSLALNDLGTVIAVQLYEPYGQMNYGWGSMPTTHNYTGQRLDSQSGLLYYQFRWYDPFSGQFTRTDSVQDNSGGMDPYAYVGNNPETRTDPTGQYYTDGSPYDRGIVESDTNGDGGHYILVYIPSNHAAPSLNDEWVNYTHVNKKGEVDVVAGWADNGRRQVQCAFGCNSNNFILGATVLAADPAADAAATVVLAFVAIALLVGIIANAVTQGTAGSNLSAARTHQGDLPIAGAPGVTGPYVFVPAKGVRGDLSRAWDKEKGGFRDAYGNVWVWDKGADTVGNPHWDVEHPDHSHTNVNTDGTINHGDDNFP